MTLQKRPLRTACLSLFSAITIVLSANAAQAQQVVYTPIEVVDKDGIYTDCGFQFVATLAEGYGLQGKAMFNQFTHLDFDVTAGKLVGGALQPMPPKNVLLSVPGNYLQGAKSRPIPIYSGGKHIEKLPLPRKRVTYSLIDDMLPRGFNISYTAADNTKIELDFPPDRITYGKFTSGCRAKMIYQAQQNYQKNNKDATCWENPSKCRAKKAKKQ